MHMCSSSVTVFVYGFRNVVDFFIIYNLFAKIFISISLVKLHIFQIKRFLTHDQQKASWKRTLTNVHYFSEHSKLNISKTK